jgi:hypothetical protein
MATYFPVQGLTIVWAGWRTEMDGTADLDVHFSHRMQKAPPMMVGDVFHQEDGIRNC